MSESTVLKFNNSDSFVLSTTLIYKYRLQWVWVQRWHQTHNIRNVFDSYVYSFRFISLEKNFIHIYSLSCCYIYKKEERQRQQAKQIHNLLLSIVVFVRESYLFCASYVELWRVEINNIMRFTKCEYDEYFKLWMWVVCVWY